MLRKNALPIGQVVEVYRNLHNGTLSIRHNGRVIRHHEEGETLTLGNVRLVVQPAGQARVRREGRKNVHAFIRGTVLAEAEPIEGLALYYNPYAVDHWTAARDGKTFEVHDAQRVQFKGLRPVAQL